MPGLSTMFPTSEQREKFRTKLEEACALMPEECIWEAVITIDRIQEGIFGKGHALVTTDLSHQTEQNPNHSKDCCVCGTYLNLSCSSANS